MISQLSILRQKTISYLAIGLLAVMTTIAQTALATDENKTTFIRIPTQYTAALGDPDANSGNDAQ